MSINGERAPTISATTPQSETTKIERSNRGDGCVYARKGSNNLWIKYSRHGRSYQESSGTSNPRKAEKLLKQRLGSIQNDTFLEPKTRRVRVEELADDLIREYAVNDRRSIDDLKTRWKYHLQPFFGLLRANMVNPDDLDRYVERRQQEGASNGSINRELAALKRAFRLGQKRKKMGAVPEFPHLEENNVRTGFADDHHCQKLLESCPELWFRTLVECGRTYGWRISELLNLRVKQVDLAARTVRLEPGTTKNREGRTVTMTQAVWVLLTACIHGKRPDDYVFTRSDGKPVRDFRVAWHKACCAAGIGRMTCRTCGAVVVSSESPKWQPCSKCKGTIDDLKYQGLIFHDLRRTAARDLRRAGVAEGVIMKIGGWKTRSVFERYSIVSTSDITDGVKKLEASRNSYSSVTVDHSAGHSVPAPTGQQIVN